MAKSKRKKEVFEILSKGLFICSNSTDTHIQRSYNYVDEEFDGLKEYFNEIDFILERGDEYFYFSKTELKADLTRKLETAHKWIDIVDFFKTYDNSFSSGYRFTPAEIQVKLKVDALLKNKLSALKRYTKQENEGDGIQRLIDLLKREGYVELENEISASYKILSSFAYLEQLVLSIHIPEDVQNEITE